MHLLLVRYPGFCNGPFGVNTFRFQRPAAEVLLLSAVGARPLHHGV
jgi:hypothetical protein